MRVLVGSLSVLSKNSNHLGNQLPPGIGKNKIVLISEGQRIAINEERWPCQWKHFSQKPQRMLPILIPMLDPTYIPTKLIQVPLQLLHLGNALECSLAMHWTFSLGIRGNGMVHRKLYWAHAQRYQSFWEGLRRTVHSLRSVWTVVQASKAGREVGTRICLSTASHNASPPWRWCKELCSTIMCSSCSSTCWLICTSTWGSFFLCRRTARRVWEAPWPLGTIAMYIQTVRERCCPWLPLIPWAHNSQVATCFVFRFHLPGWVIFLAWPPKAILRFATLRQGSHA